MTAQLDATRAGEVTTFYHATFRRHLPSIYRHGLGGRVVEQNWDGCEPGVYLGEHPALCIFVMFDQYAQFGAPDSRPAEHIAEIAVIVIDDTRIDRRKLAPDPLIARKDVHRHLGPIDVRGMPVLSVDEALAGCGSPERSTGVLAGARERRRRQNATRSYTSEGNALQPSFCERGRAKWASHSKRCSGSSI